jgi:DNA-binding transcriptional regulator YiaG
MTKKKTKAKISRRSKKARKAKKPKSIPPKAPSGPWDAQRIANLRNKLGLTQEQFAQKLSVTYVSVNRWENGKALPKGLSIKALETLEAAA